MVPRETVSFVFPRVLMFPETKSRGKTKLISFPRDHTLSVLLNHFVIFLDFPLNNHINKDIWVGSIPTEVKRFFLYLVWFPDSLY